MFILFRPAGLQMVWEKDTQDDLGQVPLTSPNVHLHTLQNDLKMSPTQDLHTGDLCIPSSCRG